MLAFELPESKKVLLFVGDAQRGNWMSWNDGSWKDGDKTVTTRICWRAPCSTRSATTAATTPPCRAPSSDDYPNLAWMGHGRYAQRVHRHDHGGQPVGAGDAEAAVGSSAAVDQGGAAEEGGGRVFQTDTAELVAPEAGDAEWADFIQRTRISDLYFEYEVHDR